jgi:uncharacterized membrane protein YgcG
MKTTKFLISLLLLFAMCLSLMSSAALAEEVGAGDEGGDETIVEEGSGESGEAPGEGGEGSGEGGEGSGESGEGSGESGEGSGESGEAPGEGEEEKKDEEKKDPEPASSVTPLSTINYYKGGSGMGGDKSFSVKPEPEQVILYSAKGSASLYFSFSPSDPSDPALGGTLVISESGNKSTFESLPAGAYNLEFRFKDAPSVTGSFYIFLSASLNTNRHIKGSGEPITVSITDKPDKVILAESSSLAGGKTLSEGSDYSFAGNTLTLTSACLDSVGSDSETVTRYVAFVVNYNGSNMAAPFPFTVVPPASIDPTETTWKRGTDKSFTVKPDVVSASLDGAAIGNSSYTASGTSLTVKASAISSLTWGEHTLTVKTSAGDVSAKITIEPSLGYASSTGNQHAKGGSGNIIFIASDPVSKVYVNGTEISSEHYTISDGKNITLKASYLNTLKADTTYTITATVSNNGETKDVSSSFKITSGGSSGGGSSSGGSSSGGSSSGGSSSGGSSSGKAPATGDSTPALWIALLILSGCGCAVILPRLRREN